MSDITGRLVTGSLWITLARVLVNALAMLSTFVLAWYLLPSDFGIVAMGTTILYIVTSVTEFSLNAAITRLPDPTDEHLNTAFSLNAIRGIGLCLLIASLAWPLASWFNEGRLVPVVIAQGIGLFISGFANPRLVLAQRSLIFWPTFIVTVGQKLAGVVAGIVVAAIFQSYWALVVGSLATQIASVVLSYVLVPYLPKFSLRYWRDLLGFSAWLSIGWTVSTINWRFDELIVGKLFGGSSLGYFSMGSNLAMMPTREVTAPLVNPIYPAFASLQHDRGRLAAAFQRSQALVTALALPAGFGFAIVSDPFVRLALGEKWLSATFIMQALACIFALQVLGSLGQVLAMAIGETRRLFVRDSQILGVALILVTAGAFFAGLKGVVIARVIVGLFTIFANLMLVRKLIGVGVRDQILVNRRALISVVALVAAGALVQHLYGQPVTTLDLVILISLCIMIGGGTYIGCTALQWWLAGCPPGPETELLNLASRAIIKLRRDRRVA